MKDYARLKIVHDQCGIYLDADVEVVHSLDDLLGDDIFWVWRTRNTSPPACDLAQYQEIPLCLTCYGIMTVSISKSRTETMT